MMNAVVLARNSKLAVALMLLFLSAVATLAPRDTWAAIDARLMRYPDVSRDKIVFTYSGDLWIVPITGGRAYRLTSDGHESGFEKQAKFSPDGTRIAYSATSRDNRDIYTLGIEGGKPHRVTYHPGVDNILDWAAKGDRLLFSSDRYSERPRYNKLFTVAAQGGLPEQLPLAYGETAALSIHGNQLIYSYRKDFQEESWKRYHGGRAPDLWLFDRQTGESKRLTDYSGPDSQPMWVGDSVYYLSEQGEAQRSNIWSLNLNSGAREQLTHYRDYDVRHPSLGPAHIVFQQGGKLLLMSLADRSVKEVKVDLVIDQPQITPALETVADQITGVSISAGADAVYFAARGEIFSLDAKYGVAVNLTNTPAVAERYPAPSPNGQYLAYFSDAGGEYQLVVRNLAGGSERTYTHFAGGYRYLPQWSPDNSKLVFIDNAQVLHLVDLDSGKITEIDRGLRRGHGELEGFRVSWSPDSRWLAFSRHLANLNQAVFVYQVRKDRLTQLTDGSYNDFDPVFDPDGNYLYLLSQRQFAPVFGDIDETWTYANSTVIALVPLTAREMPPFSPGWKMPENAESVRIDSKGFEQRLVILPLTAGRYTALRAVSGKLLYLQQPAPLPGVDQGPVLKLFDLETQSEERVLADVTGFEPDRSGATVLVQTKDNRFGLIKAQKDQELKKKLATDTLQMPVDRQAEYGQMLTEAMRYVRDFFYDPGIHGLDWPQVVAGYRQWLPYVTTDEDMTVLLRELAAELSGGHVWATATERWRPNNRTVGLLGVDFERSGNAYRIKKIYPGARYAGGPVSPLAAPGLQVQPGDYLLAVNGIRLSAQRDPWAPFVGLADRVVRLSVGKTSDLKQAREILVNTITDEQKLRELDWVESNRRKVAQASDGRLGYIYVPDTSLNGQNDLMRQFRSQFHHRGLLIDERFNMGGALGDRFIELLNRPPLNYFSYRNAADYALPTIGHGGPKALITNGWSYSGGDGFPLLFKTAKLGLLIGTQTWGGLIGPNLALRFINGGAISAPPQRVYDIWGNWAEGNEGVRPNIEVVNDPATLYRGEDAQLDRAVSELMKAVRNLPEVKVPAFPSTHHGDRY